MHEVCRKNGDLNPCVCWMVLGDKQIFERGVGLCMSDWSDYYSGHRVAFWHSGITMSGSVVRSPGWVVPTLLHIILNYEDKKV